MKRYLFASLPVFFAVAGASDAPAQNVPSDSFTRNRFGLSYRMGFNISAKFENVGGFPARTDAGLAAAGINHTYDNGFNYVDDTGNLPLPGTTESLTTYWGYQNASQVAAGNQSVVMDSSSAGGVATEDLYDSPHSGLELTYNRALGHSGPVLWGVEAGFNYMALDFSDNSTMAASVTRVSDTYNLGGVLPPIAPYSGLPSEPGPFLGDTPRRTARSIPGGATIAGSRDFSADLFGFRVGPYMHVPISRRFFATLSGGLAVAAVNSDFSFSESVTIPGVGTTSRAGSGSDSDVLVGGFFAGTVHYTFTPAASAFLGYQYQNVGDYRQTVGGKQASLNLGESIFLTLGLGYSF